MTLNDVPEPWRRQRVEDFLFHEAALLDEWRLNEWLALLTTDVDYRIPSLARDGRDESRSIALVFDDRERIVTRVEHLLAGLVAPENPRSRTRRIITNVRILESSPERARIVSNFVVYRCRSERMDTFVGQYEHGLVARSDTILIEKRRAILDMDVLRPHGMVSFIL